jgi:hypothetical protein
LERQVNSSLILKETKLKGKICFIDLKKKLEGKKMFTHSKEVFRKGKIKYSSQVIYEGDIKRLLNATSH